MERDSLDGFDLRSDGIVQCGVEHVHLTPRFLDDILLKSGFSIGPAQLQQVQIAASADLFASDRLGQWKPPERGAALT